MKKKKFLIHTLGCKVNQYESSSFLYSFEEAGLRPIKPGEDADIVVVNTCAVTAKAGAESRRTVRRLMRRHPGARLVITGCYVHLAAGELAEIVEDNICIVGNGNKHLLAQTALKESTCDLTMLMGKILKKDTVCRLPMDRFSNRTRAYLKVQDGCSNFCTYCIVPYTRGPSRSVEPAEIMEQADRFARAGHREIVVTGIHVGQYGRDLEGNHDIASLMLQLCLAHPAIRFRLSSIEPQEISTQLLDNMADCDNFMPHFHIPLQSGNNTILKRMRRGYDREIFRHIIGECLTRFPDAAVGIDILTGFPGEGEAEFNDSRELLQELAITYLHVFPYSRRPGTPAASFKEQVPKDISSARLAELQVLGLDKQLKFYAGHLNSTRPVLVEKKRDRNNLLTGFTDNYIPVTFRGTDDLMGRIIAVKLEKIEERTVSGTVVE